MRADFQEYYGLNVDDMGSSYTHEHAAVLLTQLPRTSRISREEHPEHEWGDAESMLSLIEFWVHCIWWGMTKDGKKGSNKPRPIPSPAEEAIRKKRLEGANKAFVDDILGLSNG